MPRDRVYIKPCCASQAYPRRLRRFAHSRWPPPPARDLALPSPCCTTSGQSCGLQTNCGPCMSTTLLVPAATAIQMKTWHMRATGVRPPNSVATTMNREKPAANRPEREINGRAAICHALRAGEPAPQAVGRCTPGARRQKRAREMWQTRTNQRCKRLELPLDLIPSTQARDGPLAAAAAIIAQTRACRAPLSIEVAAVVHEEEVEGILPKTIGEVPCNCAQVSSGQDRTRDERIAEATRAVRAAFCVLRLRLRACAHRGSIDGPNATRPSPRPVWSAYPCA
jgi:hypothetical protein